MQKKCWKLGSIILLAGVLFIAYLYADHDIGIPAAGLVRDIRSSQKIQEDWTVDGTVSGAMAAYISYPQDQSDHTFSVYVDRPGISFGYFFRGGGSLGTVQRKIAVFTVEGYPEQAYISMNQSQVTRAEIDDGTSRQVLEIDPHRPFALVLPAGSGIVTFYDAAGTPVETFREPL